MLSKTMQDALNRHLNAEMYSSYLYLSMAAHFHAENLPGMAHWMGLQAKEEAAHAQQFFSYIAERGGRVLLSAIEAPATQWDSPLAAFEAALEHDRLVSGRIHGLMDQALAEKDHATAIFLQWFVTEQVEEEAHAEDIVHKLRMVGGSAGSLLMIDHQLAKRA